MIDPQNVRRAAIDHHHLMTRNFESYYQQLAQSRFSSAFTYGRAKLDAMIDELFANLPKGGSVLDVGCGTGEHLKRAQGHGLEASGVEPAAGMLEVARRNVPGARIEQGVSTELPFEDAQFDAVIQIEVLRYLHRDDIHKSLQEARRVLRPGGVLFVTLVNRWALDGFYLRQKIRQLAKGAAFDTANPHCEFFSPAEAERELRRAGFVETRTEGRLLAPLRLAYKVSPALGRSLAERLETFDDRLHGNGRLRGVAGHLMAIGRVPE